MLPRPVTGSHPAVALNPELQHGALDGVPPVYVQQLLLPEVMSLKTPDLLPFAYNVGFKNPTDVKFCSNRAAFTRETEAKRKRFIIKYWCKVFK